MASASVSSKSPAAPAPAPLPTISFGQDGVATISLCHPAKRNPLTLEALRTLDRHLAGINPRWRWSDDWLGLDPLPDTPTRQSLDLSGDLGLRVRSLGVDIDRCGVVLLRGDGPVFSAGHDLREFGAQDPEFQATLFAQCQKTMISLRRLPQPVVAVIGPGQKVSGAGMQLAFMCDLIVAHPTSQFQFPGVNLNGWCVTPQLPLAHPSRSVPTQASLRMLLTGEWVSGADAIKSGLVAELAEDPEARARALCKSIAARNREGVVIGKWSFWRINGGAGKEFEATFNNTTKLVLNLQTTQSMQKGAASFFKPKV